MENGQKITRPQVKPLWTLNGRRKFGKEFAKRHHCYLFTLSFAAFSNLSHAAGYPNCLIRLFLLLLLYWLFWYDSQKRRRRQKMKSLNARNIFSSWRRFLPVCLSFSFKLHFGQNEAHFLPPLNWLARNEVFKSCFAKRFASSFLSASLWKDIFFYLCFLRCL